LAELFASDNLAGPLQKHGQDTERLFLNFQAYALPGKHSLREIDLIEAKPKGKIGVDAALHDGLSPPK
jgi:hypothetical protein